MDVRFVHGAGGWVDDQPLIEELRSRRSLRVVAPRFGDDDMSVGAWRQQLADGRKTLGNDVVVVGHSFGASIALLDAIEQPPAALVLLAMPHWGPQGWDVADYTLPTGVTLPDLPVELHHCADDEVVDIDHLDLHLLDLPGAVAHRHDTGGHQLVGVDWVSRVASR